MINRSLLAFPLLFVLCTCFANARRVSPRIQEASNCSDWRESLDQLVVILALSEVDSPNAITTMQQLDEHYCTRYQNQMNDLKNLVTRCVERKFSKQIINMATASTRKMLKSQCGSTSERQSLLRAFSCLHNEGPKIASQRLLKRTIRAISFARSLPEADRLPYACCTYRDFVDTLSKRLLVKKCSAQDVRYLTDMVEEQAGEALTLLCSSWPAGSEKCSQLFEENPLNSIKTNQMYRSPMRPFIDIIEGMSGPDSHS